MTSPGQRRVRLPFGAGVVSAAIGLLPIPAAGCAPSPAIPETPTFSWVLPLGDPGPPPELDDPTCTGFLVPLHPAEAKATWRRETVRRALQVADDLGGLQALVIPSFERGYAVRLESAPDGTHALRCVESVELLGLHSVLLRPAMPGRIVTVPLDGESATAVASAWDAMLRRTIRLPPMCRAGSDGTSILVSGPASEGTTWSPPPASPAGRLATIVEGLRHVCALPGKERPARLGAIARQARSLSAELETGRAWAWARRGANPRPAGGAQ